MVLRPVGGCLYETDNARPHVLQGAIRYVSNVTVVVDGELSGRLSCEGTSRVSRVLVDLFKLTQSSVAFFMACQTGVSCKRRASLFFAWWSFW